MLQDMGHLSDTRNAEACLPGQSSPARQQTSAGHLGVKESLARQACSALSVEARPEPQVRSFPKRSVTVRVTVWVVEVSES